MPHHSQHPLNDDVRKQLGLGATGAFPNGKATPADEGEIRMAIGADPARGLIFIDFGTPTAWIGLRREDAEGVVESLESKIRQLRGIEDGKPKREFDISEHGEKSFPRGSLIGATGGVTVGQWRDTTDESGEVVAVALQLVTPNGLADVVHLMRSRKAVNVLIEVLEKHRDEVFPIQKG